MSAYRVAAPATLAILAASAVALASLPARAQVSEGAVLSIIRECARIDDPSARLACYDNNVRSADANRATVPGQVQVQGGAGVALRDSTPAGFGREDVPSPDRFASNRGGQADEITATVTGVERRGFGLYAFTVEGGAEWLFTEAVAGSYVPPRVGSRLELRRGAMDGFLMRFNNQTSVRVRRVR